MFFEAINKRAKEAGKAFFVYLINEYIIVA